MRRRVTILLTLLVGAASAAQCYRALYWGDIVNITHARGLPGEPHYMVFEPWSFDGKLCLTVFIGPDPVWGGDYPHNGWFCKKVLNSHVPSNDQSPNFLGFACFARFFEYSGSPEAWYQISVPWWFLTFLAASMTALLIRADRRANLRHQRLATGLCVRCGYDLRATPGRCPECGTSVDDKHETIENARGR